MRIALYQMHIAWEDKNANIAKLEEQLKAAEQKKIDAIFLPEMNYWKQFPILHPVVLIPLF